MKKSIFKLLSLLMAMTVLANLCVFDFSAVGDMHITASQRPSVDSNGTSFDKVPDRPSEEVAVVTYECCEICGYKETVTYSKGEKLWADRYYADCSENSAFVCWVSESGEEYYCYDLLPFGSMTLKAKKVPLLLKNNEVLSFSNSYRYFNYSESGGYYIHDADQKMMHRNINRVFGVGSLPATGLNIALATYPGWEWQGSCYGMSTVAMLQHYGLIDILQPENGVNCLADFESNKDLVSKINYYQWSAAGSFLCENFALKQGTKSYSQQLKDVYKTVSEGNIVLFTYYMSDIFKSTGHTVLLTGAYTQKDGTKVLVAYDCNYPGDYCYNYFEQRFYIDPDFTTIERAYRYPAYGYDTLGAFNWTDDVEHFEPFNMNGKGKVSLWYSHFASQLFRLAKNVATAALGIDG